MSTASFQNSSLNLSEYMVYTKVKARALHFVYTLSRLVGFKSLFIFMPEIVKILGLKA